MRAPVVIAGLMAAIALCIVKTHAATDTSKVVLERLMALETAQAVHFKGFLVSPRYGKSVTLHVQDFKTL